MKGDLAGSADRALTSSQEAMALAKQVQHPSRLALALSWVGIAHWNRREPDLALEYADQNIALTERLGFATFLGSGRALRSWARALSGEGEDGVAEMRQALGELAQAGTGIGAPGLLIMLAEAS